MNRGQIISLVAVVGLTIGLVMYIQKQSQRLYMMDYEFKNVKISGIGSQAITFSFDLELTNTSDLDVKVRDVNFKVLWNNKQVGKVESRQAYLIPKRSTKALPLVLTLSRSELNEAVGDALSSLQNFIQGVVKIQGTMNISADFFTINQFPFDYEDTASNVVGYSISSVI